MAKYSDEERGKRFKKFVTKVEGGASIKDAAKACGVTTTTIRKWAKAENRMDLFGEKKSKPKATKSKGLTLVTPKGYRVENMNTRQLVEVLKKLG